MPARARLPRPYLPLPRLQATSPCLENPDTFFPNNNKELAHARAGCADCRIRDHHLHDSCLPAALERGEPYGVWSGVMLHHGTVRESFGTRGRKINPKARQAGNTLLRLAPTGLQVAFSPSDEHVAPSEDVANVG